MAQKHLPRVQATPQEREVGRPMLGPLTSIRFYFALLVVLFHLIPFMNEAGMRPLPEPIHTIVYNGFLGVSFFFVLSGFILVYTYFGRLEDRREDRQFWQARFARIYPGYCVGLALSLPIFGYAIAISQDKLSPLLEITLLTGLNLLAVQSWLPAAALALNGPAWSISTEAFFYGAFPFLLRALSRASLPRLIGVASLAYAASIALGVYFWLQPIWLPDAISTALRFFPNYIESYEIFYMYFPPVRLPEFVFGCCAGIYYLRNRDALDKLSSLLALVALTMLALALALIANVLPRPVWSNGFLAPAVAMFLIGLAGYRGRLLNHRISRLLGEASFSLYVIHVPIWTLLRRADQHVFDLQHHAPAIFAGIYLILVVTLSLASLKLIEQPCRLAIRRSVTSRVSRAGFASGSA